MNNLGGEQRFYLPAEELRYDGEVAVLVGPNCNSACEFFSYDMTLEDRAAIESLFSKNTFDAVVNLAAQAGVRYSLENPHAYIDSNIVGFTNILEACRHYGTGHLVYASSSSVYGMNFQYMPGADQPFGFYGSVLVMLAIVAGMVFYMKRKDWF